MKLQSLLLSFLMVFFGFYNLSCQELDVDGSIKIGSSTNTPTAGTIRWNDTTQDFEGFNGNEWLSLTKMKQFGNTNNTESDKLTAGDAGAGDHFGWSVSIDADYACIGAPYDDVGATDWGSAYIFVRSGTTWSQQDKITANDADANDYFGWSVSIDGDYACIGAPLDDDGGSKSGSAYIFKRSGTSWSQQAKLTSNDADIDDFFGRSVSINGEYACIGAPYDDDNSVATGSTYIFKRSGTTWSQQAKLTANDAELYDGFGISVSISGDYACIGTSGDDEGGLVNSGSAYIFKRSGTSWSQQAKLIANDASTDDEFGLCVSISGDYVCIGAPYDDDRGTNSGSAYIYSRSGNSWTQQAKLTTINAGAHDNFGISVSISGDYACIGAPFDDDGGTNSGSAYIFIRSGTFWTQLSKLKASDASAGDSFGRSVSISSDHVCTGAPNDDGGASLSGSAYVFQ
ncbi:MAG: hypothetical protein HKO89_05130 [Saprospiraceae bacterium]|nr:FG-GAP repeat protein [Bacteroidia bacterium]NNK89972.1 hypothetical protein [Saprospiraceae bacterium]